jgi:hypothetical protein
MARKSKTLERNRERYERGEMFLTKAQHDFCDEATGCSDSVRYRKEYGGLNVEQGLPDLVSHPRPLRNKYIHLPQLRDDLFSRVHPLRDLPQSIVIQNPYHQLTAVWVSLTRYSPIL